MQRCLYRKATNSYEEDYEGNKFEINEAIRLAQEYPEDCKNNCCWE